MGDTKDEQYPVYGDREHVLMRSGMYIGSTDPDTVSYFKFELVECPQPASIIAGDDGSIIAGDDGSIIAGDDGSEKPRAVKYEVRVREATIEVCYALQQLLLEITTNASDHATRVGTNVRNIKVNFNDAEKRITVYNDGTGIPIRKHTQFPDLYVPEVIFSKAKAGSNFDDSQQRDTAGCNGLGAKCVMWFSSEFTLRTADGEHEFTKTWRNNGDESTPAKVVRKKRKTGGYTEVSFVLDFPRLNVTDVPTAFRYLESCVWNICPVTKNTVAVHLNGTKLPIRSLKEYAKAISPDSSVLYEEVNERLQIAVFPALNGRAVTAGFVNAIPVPDGTHISHVYGRLVQIMSRALKRDVKLSTVRQRVSVAVNCIVNQPKFEGQYKDKLTTPWTKKNGLDQWEPSEAFERALRKHELCDEVKQTMEFEETRKATKSATSGNSARATHVSVPKLEDAEMAGRAHKRSDAPVLILTEGDSAKIFAVAGLSVVGRDWFGVWPLRGKPINPRGRKLAEVMNNDELNYLMKILGVRSLVKGLRPTTTQELRYKRILICSDQDTDGSHIAILVVNLLAFLLPELLQTEPDFVMRFATPLIRAWPMRGAAEEVHEFMTEQAYRTWFEALALAQQSKYEVKFFKGLSTSTARDAKRCFTNYAANCITLRFEATRDWEVLVDFFDKDRSEQRKQNLLAHYNPHSEVDYTLHEISVYDYVMLEYLLHCMADNERSIPHAVDGHTIASRKAQYAMQTRYGQLVRPSLRVSQASAGVAEHTVYHHGEASLTGTIIGMAQDYPLSNNINYFVPSGQFGSRHSRSAGQPRYLFTCLEELTRVLTPTADFPVYDYTSVEGKSCEPTWFVPVIPMLLANGRNGIGTGWSCNVPPHNPEDLFRWIRVYLQKGAEAANTQVPLKPWLEGFGGQCVAEEDGSFTFWGQVTLVDDTEIVVSSLPITTDKFWDLGDDTTASATKKKAHQRWIELTGAYMRQRSTDTNVDLSICFPGGDAATHLDYLVKRAARRERYTNMMLWDMTGTLRKFTSAQELAEYHAGARLALYEKRKAHQLQAIATEVASLQDEHCFIQEVIRTQGALVFKRPRDDVVTDLQRMGFSLRGTPPSYTHLLSIATSRYTLEQLAKIEDKIAQLQADHQALSEATAPQLWLRDLEAVEAAYVTFQETRAYRRENPETDSELSTVAGRKRKRATKPAATKKVKTDQ
jgi:DNA topoisomerase-2